MESVGLKIDELTSSHSRALLIACVVLVVIVIIMVMQSYGYSVPGMKSKRCKSSLTADDEVDELIESIHSKQKKPSPPAE